VVGDSGWYEEATRRLLAQGATEDEQAELWLELARARALRHDVVGATAAFTSLANAPHGAWLGHALGGYAVPWVSARGEEETQISTDVKPWAALAALAELETEPESARALRLVVALRALLYADVGTAIAELSALHESDASDLVVTGALSLLLRGRDDVDGARAVLGRAAAEVEDTELSTALHIAAGTLAWQRGDRKLAVEAFQRAAEEQPEAAASVLGWALRAAEPNDSAARSKALDALAETDPALAAIERFALEVGRGGSHDTAWDALTQLRAAGDTPLGRAGELARALWGLGSDAETTQREALSALAGHGPEVAELSRALSHQLELAPGTARPPDATRLLETAQHWTESETSPAPTLEWLAAAIAANDSRKEVEARRVLSRRLPEPASHALAASAVLVAELSGQAGSAPLDSSQPANALANLELSGPGMDPGQRARALLEARPSLGEECLPLATAMAGFNQLAAGDVDGAVTSFRSVVEAHPNEVIGWEGLRATALAQGDRATLAEASAALGDAVGDAALGARLWEEAATILLDELGDTLRGEFALSRATERDIGRFSAFDRLFRLVRARKDHRMLLDLIARREKVASDPQEIVRLDWERARALREAGDREGALAALNKVRQNEPDHVGALALTGEICITLQRFEEAADNLSRLAQHPEAPGQQRLISGVAAVDLYENRLKNLPRALEVLSGLYRAGLSTLPVRERLARTAAKAGAWEQATEVLEQLMAERETAAGRIEAARLAMAIYRDELGMPDAAQDAVKRLLGEAPGDGEALDLVLSGAFATSISHSLLQRGLDVLVRGFEENPSDRVSVERVARIAGQLGLLPLRQAALGVLVALGADAKQIDPELRGLDDRVARQPRIAIDDASLPALVDPEDGGPVASLVQAIATAVAEALGPGLGALGVGKKERIDPRAGLPLRNEVIAWAGALGIGELELYVGGNDPQGVCAVATETPALVLGKDVTAPLSPFHRQAVARELLSLRRGTSVLRHREPAEVHALVVAACRIAEVDVPSPAFALLGEFQRQLKIPRRVRKILPDLARAFASSGQDPVAWYRAATSTLDRMAVVAAGDVSWVLAGDARTRGRANPTLEGEQRARRLLAFVLSPTYLELREKLGMGVR
jgi:tetratricopeptide (TPR) repeat protein